MSYGSQVQDRERIRSHLSRLKHAINEKHQKHLEYVPNLGRSSTLLLGGLLLRRLQRWQSERVDVGEGLPDGGDPLVLVLLGARPHRVRVQVAHVDQVEGERPPAK